MKRFLLTLGIFAATIGFIWYTHPEAIVRFQQTVYYAPCETPRIYKIGTIDKRFGITELQLKDYIQAATDILSKAYGKELFHYDPQGQITVNLLYDTRQFLNTQIDQLQNTLDVKNSSLENRIAAYQTQVALFKQKIAAFNAKVQEWNSQGGAPENEYKKLNEEQTALQAEQSQLNALAQELNISTNAYNAEVGELRTTINTFNKALTAKPEEGLYDPEQSKIDIYFLKTRNEIIHTLAHEFGHALGIEHTKNPASIMFPLAGTHIDITDEDIAGLQQACKPITIFDRLQETVQRIEEALTKKR